jgi:hypothetical protein
MKALGNAFALAGGIASLTIAGAFPGAALSLVGFAFQLSGTWLAAGSSDIAVFLRACHWGRGTRLRDTSSNGFGYTGELSQLKNDIPAQHRAISSIYFPFAGRFIFDGSRLWADIAVERSIHNWAAEVSGAWSIEATVTWRPCSSSVTHTRRYHFTEFSCITIREDLVHCERTIPGVGPDTESLEIEFASITFNPFQNPLCCATRMIHYDTLHPNMFFRALNTTTAAR